MTGFVRAFARDRLPALLAGAMLVFAFSAAQGARLESGPDAATPVENFSLASNSLFAPTQVAARDLLVAAPVTEDLTLDFGYRLESIAGLFNKSDANFGYRGIFVMANGVNSPYASLTDGGSFLGATLKLANDLHFGVAQSNLTPTQNSFDASPYGIAARRFGSAGPASDQRRAGATVAFLNWDATSWAGIGLTASQTAEHNGMFGQMNEGVLAVADRAETTAVGISGRIGLGEGWVTTASYSEGITQLDLKPSAIIASTTDLRTRSYGISVAKHGLFGNNDSLGLALSRPIQIYSGSANLISAINAKIPVSVYGQYNLSLATRMPETDVELGYVTTFFDGALALQTNAAYQMNPAGQNGKSSLAVVSRAKINF